MNNVIIYGKKKCKFCNKAKELLRDTGISYTYIDVEINEEAMKFIKAEGATQVPQIYDSNGLIGGYTQLKNILA